MGKVIVGVFHTYGQAQAAVRDLELDGISGEQVEVISGPEGDVRGVEWAGQGDEHGRLALGNESAGERGSDNRTIGERISHFFRSLTGSEQTHVPDDYAEDHEFYAGEVRQGRTMLVVRPLSEQAAERAVELMRSHGGAGVHGEKELTAVSARSGPEIVAPRVMGNVTSSIGDPDITTGNYREDLEGRGKEMRPAAPRTVRVYVTGAPLKESIPTQRLRDPQSGSFLQADYRRHYDTKFSGTGAAYEDYSPAYQFGSRMANDERYRGLNYADAESNLRRDYETNYPGSPWEKFKEAVRYGWDRITGKRAQGAGT